MKKYIILLLVLMFSTSLFAIKHSELPISECHILTADSIKAGKVGLEYGGLDADISGWNGVLQIIGGVADSVTIGAQDSGSIVTVSDTATLTNKTISGASNTLSNIAVSSLSGINDSTKILTSDGFTGTSTKKTTTGSDTVITVDNFRTGYISFDSSQDSIDVMLPDVSNFSAGAMAVFTVRAYTNDIDVMVDKTGAEQNFVLTTSNGTSLSKHYIEFEKVGSTFAIMYSGYRDWIVMGGAGITLKDTE